LLLDDVGKMENKGVLLL